MNRTIPLGSLLLLLLFISVWSAPYTPKNAPWNVNVNPDGSNPSAYYGKWENHQYFPSPADWRQIPIYQFITDRFADGNPLNNDGTYGGYDLYRVDTRHGGDFIGITAKLDYIKALGYKAIWISPVFQNMENSYHGYAQIDFTVLDDRFGTVEEMRQMVDKAHSLGLYVVVDIVMNHMANLIYFENHQDQATPFHLHQGEYKLFYFDQNRTYTDFWIDNHFISEGQYCDLYNDQGFKVVDSGEGSYWNSDFHHNGDLRDYSDVYQNHLGKIYGIMDDLRTSHPRVQDKIIAMTKSLIASTDIDAIRMDTPMQVPLYAFQRWAPAVREYAASLGKRNFAIFGEFYCSRERASTMTGRGKTPNDYGKNQFISTQSVFNGGIHYPAYYWFTSTIKDQQNNLNGMRMLYEQDKNDYDWYNPSTSTWGYHHFLFFNNHDQWRMSAAMDGFNKTMLSSAVLAFWPGVPLYYYGDEQGFLTRGTALDGWSREDFMTSVAWDNMPTVGPINPAQGDNFNMVHPYFLYVKQIMNIRRNYKNLQTCDDLYERWVQSGNTNGVYAFSRTCGDASEWVLVVFNTWRDPITISSDSFFTGWKQGDAIVNLFNNREQYTLQANGGLSNMKVNGYETKVFVLKQSVKSLDPMVVAMDPTHDQVMFENRPITIQFSEPMDCSVLKTAVQLNGKFVNFVSNEDCSTIFIQQNLPDGIHKITIDETKAKSAKTNLFMNGNFVARIRKGNAQNIIMVKNNSYQPNICTVSTSNTVQCKHNAAGAELVRIQVNDLPWSDWIAYQSITTHQLSQSVGGSIRVTVQYYTDCSAAYFVKNFQ